ncbi:hypothetical protein AAKU61_000516 [Undibacterium sp. GrIS 1.2]|uniref:hypothetical protein n=1 Tax=Undibacterium sp. GrIS 1.2 TaxID=3143933 RepID=UPI0033946A15
MYSTRSTMLSRLYSVALISALSIGSQFAYADGLSDLKTALVRLQGATPVKANLEAKTWSRQGDGKDADERSGIASVQIEEGPRGLQVYYSRDLLSRLETEERAREKDPKAKTPTLSALNDINSSELRPLIYAANSLSRAVEKAVFRNEKADTYNGKPARLLSFEMTIDKMTEKDRKYIKKYEGNLDIWIAAGGTPLASRMHETASGRAFIVISFETSNDNDQVYGLVGDRLVITRKETKSSGAGAGEKGEMRSIKTLQLQS